MAIDSQTESLLTLADAARALPRRRAGRKTAVATLYRWSSAGCRGIVLETIQIGSTRCTSKEALQRFFDRLTVRQPSPAVPAIRPNRQAVKAAEAILDAAGI